MAKVGKSAQRKSAKDVTDRLMAAGKVRPVGDPHDSVQKVTTFEIKDKGAKYAK